VDGWVDEWTGGQVGGRVGVSEVLSVSQSCPLAPRLLPL
jgi:hypothetical protein